MSHRVIAGQAKGRRLRQVPGNSTRPIMDRAKEALFNILGDAAWEAQVLDLFGGSGAVGIEALSRGASWVTFVDNDREAVRTMHENLRLTHFTDAAEVLHMDAFDFLRRKPAEPYSLVYVAPPQYQSLWKRALLTLDAQQDLLEPDALVIVQIDPQEKETLTLDNLFAYDERTYGNTLLWFFEYDAVGADDEPTA
ncbi:MAG: 16S rRNA (guanine(966)-N(2))-methyltransferase RsmD [Anaerolineae bacterium]|nr:16S rRNA (guanine(966)-N(2))-methyltransferase RsmD [Anaerolineae bacterium]